MRTLCNDYDNMLENDNGKDNSYYYDIILTNVINMTSDCDDVGRDNYGEMIGTIMKK